MEKPLFKYFSVITCAILIGFSSVSVAESGGNDGKLDDDLFKAIRAMDVAKVTKLIQQGASVNVKRSNGKPLLEFVFDISKDNKQEREQILNLLISHGADVKHIASFNMTYLHYSVSNDMLSTTKLLLDKGVDPSIKASIGAQTPIFFAESPEMIELLVNHKGGRIDERDEDGNSLLHQACGLKPSLRIVQYLGEKLPIDITNKKGDTPLITALGNDYFQDERKKIIDFLLSKGAKINFSGYRARTPLIVALRNRKHKTNIIDMLIKHGAKINIKDKYGNQPIHFSAASSFRYFQILAANGADLNALTDSDETPLIAATRYNREVTVRYLLDKKVKLNVRDKTGKTALNYAKEGDLSDIVMLLEERGAVLTPVAELKKIQSASDDLQEEEIKEPEITNIKQAISAKNIAEVKKFYTANNKDDDITKYDLNKLMKRAVRDGNLEIVKYFVSEGADITNVNVKGYSLLHFAVFYGQLEIVKYLVEQGLDINAESIDGRRVFVLLSNSTVPVAKYLLNKNINKEKDRDIVDEAVRYQNPEMAKYFMGLGYHFNKDNLSKQDLLIDIVKDSSVETLDFLIQQGLDIEQKIKFRGKTATLLHFAILLDRKKMSLYLLSQGANPNARSRDGEAIFKAAINNEDMDVLVAFYDKGADLAATTGVFKETPLQVAFNLQRVNVIRLLVEKGANVNEVIGSGKNTPLHHAARLGYLDIVKLLIKKGAKVNVQNRDKKTPLDIAKEREQSAVVKYLTALSS